MILFDNKLTSSLRRILLGSITLLLASCPIKPPPIILSAAITAESTASENAKFTLSAAGSSISSGSIESYRWEQVNPLPGKVLATIDTPSSQSTTVQAYVEESSENLTFRLTVTGGGMTKTAEHRVTVNRGNIDLDGDGLIEIRSLTMLHNMRHNLAGTSYKTSDSDAGTSTGCPGSPATCTGYELVGPLSFDKDGDGSTWAESNGSFTLDADDSASPYFVTAEGGWLPIGGDTNPFTAIFDGNGHTITGLAISRRQNLVGLFSTIAGNARNIGLLKNLSHGFGGIVGTIQVGGSDIGGLIGRQDGGILRNSYASGTVVGYANIGSLVGTITGGSIVASHGTGEVSASINTTFSGFGGLVGSQTAGSIVASYTSASVVGKGQSSAIGGLLGHQTSGIIIASYASGNVSSSNDSLYVGGLVGYRTNLSCGKIIASYATGNASGKSSVGGLVGSQWPTCTIAASYAEGDATASGTTNSDTSGSLVGLNLGGIGMSYAFGTSSKTTGSSSSGAMLPSGVRTSAGLTESNAGTQWNSATDLTENAWDFGTTSQAPALRYADYDGTGTRFYCEGTAKPTPAMSDPEPIEIPNCGEFIPGQR